MKTPPQLPLTLLPALALTFACGEIEYDEDPPFAGESARCAHDEASTDGVGQSRQGLSVNKLWPNGLIRYEWQPGIAGADRTTIRDAMDQWENATGDVVRFVECAGASCPATRLWIRRNVSGTDANNHACTIGMVNNDAEGTPRMRFWPGIGTSTALHELGHCMGLAHEHVRKDASRFLIEYGGWTAGDASESEQPLLGNYDYDSIMHYRSRDGATLRFKDLGYNEFGRGNQLSAKDVSRVQQYYAKKHQPNWSHFEPVSRYPNTANKWRNPWLATNVKVVGTPAVAYRGSGRYAVFARGSNDHLYWKSFNSGGATTGWNDLGGLIGSDPAAVGWNDGAMDVFFIGKTSGNLIRVKYRGNSWGGWFYANGGAPSGGIKAVPGGFMGPAVSSRGNNYLEVFVVKANGGLSGAGYAYGAWGAWKTISGVASVSARPAAAAIDGNTVHLAVTTYGSWLRELNVDVNYATVGGAYGHTYSTLVEANSAPAVTKRNSNADPYRVVVVSTAGRLMHRFANGSWREIGGIPKPGTGVSAIATGSYSANIVMNGEDVTGCVINCTAGTPGEFIMPGGVWLRRFL